MRSPTDAERKVLKFLLENPGMTIFKYYDHRRGGSFGMERVAVRGAAGRMHFRLLDAGFIEARDRHTDIVTAAGEEALRS